VKSCCDELSARHGVRITFRDRGVPAALPMDVALCVFRIAQEALRNVVRHSGSPEARVVLSMAGRAVRLCVSDSGAGFDIEAAARKKGLGLVSMTERLRLVGGELAIRSGPTRGTEIDARVPLAEAVADFETTAAGGGINSPP
jgi:signal transduction histidine kinase